MTNAEWNLFLDHLVQSKVYVIENWKLSVSKIQILMYDHGIIGPRDDTELDFYKGECDASFDTKSASLAFVIWQGDKIIYAEIFKNITCESATEGELYAAFALLSQATELGIQKLLVCSDCLRIIDVLSGELCIQNVEAPSSEKDQREKAPSSEKDQREKAYNQLVLHLMLRSMKRHFRNLVSMWKPRELMVIADDLAKANELIVGQPYYPSQALKKWSNYLKGLPVFRFERTEYAKKKIAKFGKVQLDESHGKNTDSIFYIEVEDQYKFDCLSGVIQAFGSVNLALFVNDITSKIRNDPGFLEQLKKFVPLDSENKHGICSGFTYLDKEAHRSLAIAIDASISKELYYEKTGFHIVLVTAEERNIIDQMMIPELSALSLVYFNGVKFPLNDPNKKDKSDLPKKKDEQKKVSSSSKSEGPLSKPNGDGDEDH